MQTCRSCGAELPLTDFYPDAKNKQRRETCRPCWRAQAVKYRSRNKVLGRLATEKRCPRCGETKPADDFHRNKSSTDGLAWYCKACKKSWHQATEYGISPAELEEFFHEQGGACAICRKPFLDGRWNIDHCHTQGHVRGLLCRQCNVGLGMFGDDSARLAEAARYVRDGLR